MNKDLEIWNNIFENVPTQWKHAPLSQSMLNCLIFFKDNNVKSVWDMGCGVGIWSVYLAQNGFSLYGSDFSQNAIQFANQWATEKDLEINFEVGDVTRDSFPEVQFDAILLSKILENLSFKQSHKTIQLVKRKLKPKGVIYALFNPINHKTNDKLNPLFGATFINYNNKDIEQLFKNFQINSKTFVERGFRQFLLTNLN